MMPAIAIDSGGFFSPEIACQDGKNVPVCIYCRMISIHGTWSIMPITSKFKLILSHSNGKFLASLPELFFFSDENVTWKMFFDKLLGIQFL